MNALDSLARQVRAQPDAPALISAGQTHSFRQLWRRVAILATRLHGAGVRSGDGIGLAGLVPESHLLAMLACARLGAVSTSFTPSATAAERAQVAGRHGLKWWLHRAGAASVPDGVQPLAFGELAGQAAGGEKVVPMARGLQQQLWRILLSSGTTGSAKSIAWTHGQRLRLEERSLPSFAGGPGERMLVFADLGIGFTGSQLLTQLASGGCLVLPGNANPAAVVPLLRESRATRLVTTTAVAFRIAEHLARADEAEPLPHLISVLVGGAAAPPALLRALEEKLCRNVQVMYGSTEAGMLARSDPAGRLRAADTAGQLLAGIEGQAVDDADQPLPAGQVGRLRFRGTPGSIATGYFGDDAATARSFREGWFYPGDLGAIDAGRNLTLRGRVDDVVNAGGAKVAPGRIEQVLNAEPGVLESAVVGVELPDGRKVVAAAIVPSSQPPQVDHKELSRKLRAEAGKQAVVAIVKELPKNDNGKVKRQALARALAKALARGGAAKPAG
ncbi:MAG: acyl--CoA ligase [Burkholderiales bacterium]|nr:acyl--CoA ligase [Burkholderiales bacterium]